MLPSHIGRCKTRDVVWVVDMALHGMVETTRQREPLLGDAFHPWLAWPWAFTGAVVGDKGRGGKSRSESLTTGALAPPRGGRAGAALALGTSPSRGGGAAAAVTSRGSLTMGRSRGGRSCWPGGRPRTDPWARPRPREPLSTPSRSRGGRSCRPGGRPRTDPWSRPRARAPLRPRATRCGLRDVLSCAPSYV